MCRILSLGYRGESEGRLGNWDPAGEGEALAGGHDTRLSLLSPLAQVGDSFLLCHRVGTRAEREQTTRDQGGEEKTCCVHCGDYYLGCYVSLQSLSEANKRT